MKAVRSTRLNFEAWVKDNGAFEREPLTWDKVLAEGRKPRQAGSWQDWLPADRDDDYSEFGENAPMMRSVAQVVASVLRPPDAD
jgi:hypothetical protein